MELTNELPQGVLNTNQVSVDEMCLKVSSNSWGQRGTEDLMRPV